MSDADVFNPEGDPRNDQPRVTHEFIHVVAFISKTLGDIPHSFCPRQWNEKLQEQSDLMCVWEQAVVRLNCEGLLAVEALAPTELLHTDAQTAAEDARYAILGFCTYHGIPVEHD